MGRLEGKRALITGGTTGIGLETARKFLAEGARVIITGTNPATLEAAANDLGDRVLVVSSDAGDVAAQAALAQTVAQRFGQLDVLFINAGIVKLHPIEQWTEAAYDQSFAVNVKGPFFLVQALLAVFAAKASIVLNGSVNAHIGMPSSSVYAATKAALISFVRTFSGELIARGIRVNAISPGPFQHRFTASWDSRKPTSSRWPRQSKARYRRGVLPRPRRSPMLFFFSQATNLHILWAPNC